jgi:hypothetical protein
MENRKVYFQQLDDRLQVLESHIGSVREKRARSTAAEGVESGGVVEKWADASLFARRRLAELKHDPSAPWEGVRKQADDVMAGLDELVDHAVSAS